MQKSRPYPDGIISLLVLLIVLSGCSGSTDSSQGSEQAATTDGNTEADSETAPATQFDHPYGINNWQWPESTLDLFDLAGLDRYRVMIKWADFEPTQNNYIWNEDNQLSYRNAMEQAAMRGKKVSLVVYTAPAWAKSNPLYALSYTPEDYADFITKLLEHSEQFYPGVTEAIEVENETPTNSWVESAGSPVYGTEYRDPSQSYVAILKAADAAIDAYNTANNKAILTIMDAIWDGAYHHLDELYQLGCGNCFDRINFHYYLMEQSSADTGKPADPMDSSTIWHFPTVLAYLRHIANTWGDSAKPIWLTEFGWRYGGAPGFADFTDFFPDTQQEQNKADYTAAVLTASNNSGYVERTNLYVGTATPLDTMSLLYVQKDWAPGTTTDHVQTALYSMYVSTTAINPVWRPDTVIGIAPVPAAESDLNIINPGFENGTNGWSGITSDNTEAHSGAAAGKLVTGTGETIAATVNYSVEAGRLYEVQMWILIDAETTDSCIAHPSVKQIAPTEEDSGNWSPPNYWGVVDTRNYPERWRRIRFPYVASEETEQISVAVGIVGSCDVWVDDLTVSALEMY